MSAHPAPSAEPPPLARVFPLAPPLVEFAYRELWQAEKASPAQRRAIGDPTVLPRPWDPPTCTDPDLRAELWEWLDEVAAWLNTEYGWDPADTIPACWPQHPHLVHELAVLADQRRRAAHAYTSDLLEDWHRYTLPGFHDRMRCRLHGQCDDTHQSWPARSRHARYTTSSTAREARFQHDLATVAPPPDSLPGRGLHVVDLDTGELLPPDDEDPYGDTDRWPEHDK